MPRAQSGYNGHSCRGRSRSQPSCTLYPRVPSQGVRGCPVGVVMPPARRPRRRPSRTERCKHPMPRLHPWATDTALSKKEELAELLTEAQRLAEAVGNEDERWRVRIADLLWLYWRGDLTPEEVNAGRGVAMAAAAYFEARENWAALSEALDAYTVLSWMVDAWDDALAA